MYLRDMNGIVQQGIQTMLWWGDESKTKPDTFTCGMWNTDMDGEVHENPTILRSSLRQIILIYWR